MGSKWCLLGLLAAAACFFAPLAGCDDSRMKTVTVPLFLDNNRSIIEGEIRRADGSWRKIHLWIDTGSPNFIMTPELAEDAGLIGLLKPGKRELALKIGNMPIDVSNIAFCDTGQPSWLFASTGADANLPSTILCKYDVIFDFPGKALSLSKPSKGGGDTGKDLNDSTAIPAAINPSNGIVQIDVAIGDMSVGMAIDLGASYCFISGDVLETLTKGLDPDGYVGSAGSANMWGWWPSGDSAWRMTRIPAVRVGAFEVSNVGVVGLPSDILGGLGQWYSSKTAKPVAGFLGPNFFKAFRLEIDYSKGRVLLKKTGAFDDTDMDTVGIGVRIESDGTFTVTNVAKKNGKSLVDGIKPGDKLMTIDGLATTGKTMGAVLDALKGKPGDAHVLGIARDGQEIEVKVAVSHLM